MPQTCRLSPDSNFVRITTEKVNLCRNQHSLHFSEETLSQILAPTANSLVGPLYEFSNKSQLLLEVSSAART